MGQPLPGFDDVLGFWFGASATESARAEWFRKDDAFDAEVRQRFGGLIEHALGGGIDGWMGQPRPALARIVVLDQFTRNALRGTARAFAGDALALAAAQALVDTGGDRALPPLQRWFAYLPFEHAESAAAQAISLELFGALARENPGTPAAGALQWAKSHAEIIERFGRYPHRNAVLGRPSTAEEEAFLREPGSSF